MAGHSKWANIKHKKAKEDKKRGKIFTKLIRELTVAARLGGSDDSANPRLRDAITKASAANMPKDTIERAVKRGAGEDDAGNIIEIRYEGYGPGGVAVMVDCMTDNRNRTVAEVRHVFTKMGGNLGTDGSVAYMFKKIGQIFFTPEVDEDQVFELALEAGALDVDSDEESGVCVTTSAEDFHTVYEVLTKAGLKAHTAEVTMVADNDIEIADQDLAEKIIKMIDKLEDLDDVQEVYSNADIADDYFRD